MIQKRFFLLLLLVPCIASSSNQIDSIIKSLKMKDEMLQDSVTYLLQQTSIMQQQLKNLTSAAANQTKMKDMVLQDLLQQTSIMQQQLKNHLISAAANQPNQTKMVHDLKGIQKTVMELLIWKMGVKDKLRHQIDVMNMTLRKEIAKTEQHFQRENAAMTMQIIRMDQLFKNVGEVKNNVTQIEKLMKDLMQKYQDSSVLFQQTVANLTKNDADLEGRFNKRIDEKTIKLNVQITRINKAIKILITDVTSLMKKHKP